jgi:predicted HicB family RNase H-like nuclease
MARPKKYLEPRVATAVRLPPELHRRLQDEAASRDTSVNHLLVKAATFYLSHLPPLEARDMEDQDTADRQ